MFFATILYFEVTLVVHIYRLRFHELTSLVLAFGLVEIERFSKDLLQIIVAWGSFTARFVLETHRILLCLIHRVVLISKLRFRGVDGGWHCIWVVIIVFRGIIMRAGGWVKGVIIENVGFFDGFFEILVNLIGIFDLKKLVYLSDHFDQVGIDVFLEELEVQFVECFHGDGRSCAFGCHIQIYIQIIIYHPKESNTTTKQYLRLVIDSIEMIDRHQNALVCIILRR